MRFHLPSTFPLIRSLTVSLVVIVIFGLGDLGQLPAHRFPPTDACLPCDQALLRRGQPDHRSALLFAREDGG